MFSNKQENYFQYIHKQIAQLKVKPLELHKDQLLRP